MALFESYERRIDKINGVLAQYGISSVEECREICKAKGFDPYEIVKGIQPICFENACGTRPSASLSLPVMSLSPLPKALSALPAPPTRLVRSLCGSS